MPPLPIERNINVPPSDSDATLTRGESYDLLSNPRRRYVLYYLGRQDGPVSIGTLADRVAAWENDTSVEEVGSQERKRVYVSLYQTHVPKLEEAGLVRYEQDDGTIELTARIEELTAYIGTAESQRRWPLYYLVTALAGGALYLGAVLELLPAPLVGGILILVLLAVATAHYVAEARARKQLPDGIIE
jgi:hypothetical protein